jgi:septum formation protein
MTEVVLASTSPRRRVLMEQLGIAFEVVASDYVEVMDPQRAPSDLVVELALGKARAVAQLRPDAIVIGADTFVSHNGVHLGKPDGPDDARGLLRQLRGQVVDIVTGVAVVTAGNDDTAVVTTPVRIATLDDAALDAYVNSGVPLDKAGGISIEIIDRIDGDPEAVLGLPLLQVRTLLEGLGVTLP